MLYAPFVVPQFNTREISNSTVDAMRYRVDTIYTSFHSIDDGDTNQET